MEDEKFYDGLVIAGDDGEIYHIKPEDLGPFKVNVAADDALGAQEKPPRSWDLVKRLLATGVSVAVVPKTLPVGPDPRPFATCYVINLSSFAKPTRHWLPPGNVPK